MPQLLQQPPEAICIVRLSAIGDCCHVLPVARTIQSAWPGTRVYWIIGKTEHSLLCGADGIQFIIFDKRKGVCGIAGLRRQLGRHRFGVLLHMHASMRANLVSSVVRADIRLGYDRARARDFQWLFSNRKIPAHPQQHVMDSFFSFTEYLGLTERVLRWDIPVSESDAGFAAEVCGSDHPVAVISPCSSGRFRNYRNWQSENYSAVSRYLHERYGARVILTGAATPTESWFGQQIAKHGSGPLVNLIGQTSLKQLLAIISRADLLICPDSGPAHMAAAVATPVIGLYATSNRWRTGPCFCQSLVVDAYPRAVRAEFGKPVEALRWGTRVRNKDAMTLIRVADVLEKVDRVLGRQAVRHPEQAPQPS